MELAGSNGRSQGYVQHAIRLSDAHSCLPYPSNRSHAKPRATQIHIKSEVFSDGSHVELEQKVDSRSGFRV